MRQSVMERNCLGLFSALHSVRFCFWVPQYTTETFVVLSSPLKNVSARDWTYDLLLPSTYFTTATLTNICNWAIGPLTLTHRLPCTALLRFPHYIAGVSELSIMLNHNSLCFDTEKWFLCNNTIVFV